MNNIKYAVEILKICDEFMNENLIVSLDSSLISVNLLESIKLIENNFENQFCKVDVIFSKHAINRLRERIPYTSPFKIAEAIKKQIKSEYTGKELAFDELRYRAKNILNNGSSIVVILLNEHRVGKNVLIVKTVLTDLWN